MPSWSPSTKPLGKLAAHRISRRRFAALLLSAPSLAAWLMLNPGLRRLARSVGRPGAPLTHAGLGASSPQVPLDNAYVFLDQQMDLYAQGSTTRLVQSYVPTAALDLGDTGFTYDNALALSAFLVRGTSDDLARASVLGDSLVYGQQHDPAFTDGRLHDAYHVNPYVLPGGHVNVHASFAGSQTGNLAWAGLALARLYARTRQQAYLDGAAALARWIQTNTFSTHDFGGFTAGVDGGGNALTYKATEHNIDVYALFSALAHLTRNLILAGLWSRQAQHALAFVAAMWNAPSSQFWTGTNPDGSLNTSVIPEDVQAWSFLAIPTAAPYASALDWAMAHLAATDGAFSGVSFSNADTTGVWFEGTAHLAAALQLRNAPGDASTAAAYLASIELAQTQAPHQDGLGIVAASHDGLHTGFGYDYFAALHAGATAWYCLAKQQTNPVRL